MSLTGDAFSENAGSDGEKRPRVLVSSKVAQRAIVESHQVTYILDFPQKRLSYTLYHVMLLRSQIENCEWPLVVDSPLSDYHSLES